MLAGRLVGARWCGDGAKPPHRIIGNIRVRAVPILFCRRQRCSMHYACAAHLKVSSMHCSSVDLSSWPKMNTPFAVFTAATPLAPWYRARIVMPPQWSCRPTQLAIGTKLAIAHSCEPLAALTPDRCICATGLKERTNLLSNDDRRISLSNIQGSDGHPARGYAKSGREGAGEGLDGP